MSEPIEAVVLALPSQQRVESVESAMRGAEALQFEQAMQRTDPALQTQYLRQSTAPEASLPEELLAYVDTFDARFHTTFERGISDITALDFSDPMSIVRVMELQADLFSVTMELELATKLADSGRHFTTTLFNNQG